MFTTVASSTTMSCARPTTTRVSQRREEGAVGAAAVEAEGDMNVTIYETS
jgi:hypothetical protein